MSSKFIAYFLLAFVASLAWNIFLIHRDENLMKSHYRKAAIQRLSYPPSNSLKSWCERQAGWHPDCNVE